MSSLTDSEKQYLESILAMSGGYVLDYSDATFGAFFETFKVNIHGEKYQKYGRSKARKLRAFWEIESDQIVGIILRELLESYKAKCEIDGESVNQPILEKTNGIVARLLNETSAKKKNAINEDDFLNEEINLVATSKLPIESTLIPIIDKRLAETRKTMRAEAYLATVILCGSILEAILLGKANADSESYNKASGSPKDKFGKVRPIPDWKLSQLIDVSHELNHLSLDVKKFSHGLRDFRNYIHPQLQLTSRFTPDKHTARVCWQVLMAALADIAGRR